MIVAERSFHEILSRLEKRCLRLKDKRPLPREVDELLFAVLLLTSEFGAKFQDIEQAREALSRSEHAMGGNPDYGFGDNRFLTKVFSDLERTPFQLAYAILSGNAKKSHVFDRLTRLLCHADSSIRFYFFEVTWFVRKCVPTGPTVKALLRNVADKLGYVEHAIGLAGALCGNEEAFFKRAEKYNGAPAHWTQYCERIQQVKDKKLLEHYRDPFVRVELKIRSMIDNHALALEFPPESKRYQQSELPLE